MNGCPECHKSTSGHCNLHPIVGSITPDPVPTPLLLGWICPRCGRIWAPPGTLCGVCSENPTNGAEVTP